MAAKPPGHGLLSGAQEAEIRELRKQSRDRGRVPDERAASALRLNARNETFRRLRSTELLASSINDTLLKVTVEENSDRLDVHQFRLRKRLQHHSDLWRRHRRRRPERDL